MNDFTTLNNPEIFNCKYSEMRVIKMTLSRAQNISITNNINSIAAVYLLRSNQYYPIHDVTNFTDVDIPRGVYSN